MTVYRMICILLISLFVVSGCTTKPEIQNVAYATAIGVDYKNGKWIVYAQVLNFSNIAHYEQQQIGKSVPVWVGKGEGNTIAHALSNVNRTSQLSLFWGHVKVIVMTEEVLKKGVTDVYSAINRDREVRYNILIYGTKRNLDDILIQKSLMNLSPLDTMMFSSAQTSSTLSILQQVTSNRLIANLNEPGEPAIIPSIDSDNKDWKEDKKSKEMFNISGGYFFRDNKMISWMSEKELSGVRWGDRHLDRTTLEFPSNKSPVGVIMFNNPHMKIIPKIEHGKVKFDLHVYANGHIVEILQNITLKEIKKEVAIAIQKEIIETYRKAIKLQCDPFRLGQALYRSNPNEFKKLTERDEYFLSEDSLGEIQVHVRVKNMGKYKGEAP
ncbi:Ger(x)C family spore germination protein [Paenibacillus sp. L3-i20]|uniref:Ger(x)C family spore germination protein n=1 Tax=Paenibacillus sp. L3-i20 TaxID=2905833 RepID=UPI001EE05FCA|nr:Ger(x)C family spore germination protein [Paenibacillus sp. L3-i20]GKU80382.1 hypothetical protein L3i20_v247790 [Paenibacillus sp. L3-i20]